MAEVDSIGEVNPHLQQWKSEQHSLPGTRASVYPEDWKRSKEEWDQSLLQHHAFWIPTRQRYLEEDEATRRWDEFREAHGSLGEIYGTPYAAFKGLASMNRIREPYLRWAEEPGGRPATVSPQTGGASQMTPQQVRQIMMEQLRQKEMQRRMQSLPQGGY